MLFVGSHGIEKEIYIVRKVALDMKRNHYSVMSFELNLRVSALPLHQLSYFTGIHPSLDQSSYCTVDRKAISFP